MSVTDCITYEFSYYEFLIPSYKIFLKLCTSRDKTKLFIMSVIRMYIIYTLFYYLKDNKMIGWDKENWKRIIIYILSAMFLFINFMYIIVLLIKKPAIDKNDVENTFSQLAEELHNIKLTKDMPVSNQI